MSYTDFFVICSGEHRAPDQGDPRRHRRGAQARDDGLLPRRTEGHRESPLDPARLLGRGGPHLHPGGARVLPAREPLGRGAGAVRGLTVPSAACEHVFVLSNEPRRAQWPRPRSLRRRAAWDPGPATDGRTRALRPRVRDRWEFLRVQCKWGSLTTRRERRQGQPAELLVHSHGYVRTLVLPSEIDLRRGLLRRSRPLLPSARRARSSGGRASGSRLLRRGMLSGRALTWLRDFEFSGL